METQKIFDSELRFCEILWEHQPVRSSELAHLCAEKLGDANKIPRLEHGDESVYQSHRILRGGCQI